MINKIHNENCLDTMAKMEDNYVDLTVTSPPYDNLRTYNGYSFDFENIAKELYRVTKKGGVVVWVVGDATIKGSETGTSFRQALFFKECGFNLHDTMIYKRQNRPLTHNRYEQQFEYMFVLSKGKPKTFNPFMKETKIKGKVTMTVRNKDGTEIRKNKKRRDKCIIGNVWDIKAGNNASTTDRFAFEHPAIFPEKLANDHILSWSNENDIVYDPFMGSGTVAKMAILNNRNWIGSEISKDYCDIANKRIHYTIENKT
jgi:site-specific DNA-methyltransferase (adenine-specific)